GEARSDRWQELAHAAQTLVAQASSGSSTKETLATVESLLALLSVIETFRAYPGEAMMSALNDALGRRGYSSFSRISNRYDKAVTVPIFEEGVLGVVMNADVQAVIIKDNFRFKSQFDAPLLRTYLEQHLSQECGSLEPRDYGVALARAIGKIRPELDVYLVVDGAVEKVASHLDSKNIRRIFYGLDD